MPLPVLFSDADALGVDTRNSGQEIVELATGEGFQPILLAIVRKCIKKLHIEHPGFRGEDAALFPKAGQDVRSVDKRG